MKKFTSGVLAVIMTGILPMVQVQAQEITLESAVSNLQYRMTVEWDQKDAQKQKEILGEFSAQLEQLKKQGVSDEQIFKTLSSSAFDAQTSKDIELLANYAKSKKLSSKEAHQLVVDYANKSQKLGTNWSPEATAALLVGVLIATLLVVVLTQGTTVSSGGTGGGVYYPYPSCYDDCYFDYWGYYYCDTYCY